VAVIPYYHAILGAFYSLEIVCHQSDVKGVLGDVIGLMNVAEYLGCVTIITQPIETAFHKLGQVLYRSMDTNPAAWIDLCMRIRSETLFKENLRILVGQWGALPDHIKDGLKPEIKEVILRKWAQHIEKAKDLERRIFAIYPHKMTRSPEEDCGRASYANDIMSWIASVMYRHWWGQVIVNEEGARADDAGYALFKRLVEGGDAYLTRQELARFHARFNMSRKGMNVVENAVLEIKELAKSVVERSGVLDNNSSLETKKYGVAYRLDLAVADEDIPWDRRTAQKEKVRVGQADEEQFEVGADTANTQDDEDEDLENPWASD
jgi:hypothetical protein